MTTMTAEPPTASEPDVQPNLYSDLEPLEDAAEFLRENCYTVDFEVHWFATRRTASSAEAASMLKDNHDEIDPSQIGISLKLFDPQDPYIKKMHAAKAALVAYRDSATIPAAKLPMVSAKSADEEIEVGMPGERRKRILNKKPGERIIMAEDVDEFDTHVTKVLIPNLLAAVAEANAHLPEIKDRCRKKLKKRFNEANFPEEFKVGVVGPDYSHVGLNVDFEQACPSAAKRMKKAAEQRLQDTVELAVADFANTFMDTVSTAARQLGKRLKLDPPANHTLKHLKEGEVLEIKRHTDDPEIPEGSLLVEVKYVEDKRRVTEWFGPFTEEEYATLRPYEAAQSCKVYESSFERLLGELQRFEQIRTMLGDAGKPLDGIVEKVKTMLKDANCVNAAQVVDQVKKSSFFRQQGAGILANVADEIETVVDKLPIRKGTRRRAISRRKKS